MTYTQISLEVADSIATLTLERPDQLNAFTHTMVREMVDAFDRIDADDEVRAVVVTGRGRAFCAGADLSSGSEIFRDGGGGPGAPAPGGVPRDGGGEVALRIFACTKPVIAAINGHAVGVGITMTLPMDIRIVAEGAKIGFVFARRGITPEACSTWFLPRIVGISRAMEWCAGGHLLSAQEALEAGLVRDVLPAGEVLPAAYAIARRFADESSAISVSLIRQMLWRGLAMSHPMEAHRAESRGILATGTSPDAQEGISSFLDKRPARFAGRVPSELPDLFPDWVEPGYEARGPR